MELEGWLMGVVLLQRDTALDFYPRTVINAAQILRSLRRFKSVPWAAFIPWALLTAEWNRPKLSDAPLIRFTAPGLSAVPALDSSDPHALWSEGRTHFMGGGGRSRFCPKRSL